LNENTEIPHLKRCGYIPLLQRSNGARTAHPEGCGRIPPSQRSPAPPRIAGCDDTQPGIDDGCHKSWM